MPTVVSSTSRAIVDVGHLLRFRSATVRRRSSFGWIALAFLAMTLGAAVVPAFVGGAGSGEGRAFDLLILLPTVFAGFLTLVVVSSVASGGGRELLAREHAVAFPISPTTDHLGALLLAPLNIAWLIQAWALLGATGYALGNHGLLAAQIGALLWLAVATAMAQAFAWIVEGMRRRPHGIPVVRALIVVVIGVTLGLQLTHSLVRLLDQLPTRWIVIGLIDGFSGRWLLTMGFLMAILVTFAVIGAVPAHYAARRTPRDELRVETDSYPGRPLPRSLLTSLIRIDRASVWRAVPMRRGIAVLAIGPGIVALIGNLPWSSMTILPGLVASGGALLFGVNAWCLDGRGGLWRESLPVSPATVFAARAYVLAEFLLVASAVTMLLAALRAGVPTLAELTALLCTVVVVTVQVVAAALRWSAQRPFAVDLRSARATPAPPLVMVGYSTRLAVTTTLTGLVFSGLARVPDWQVSLLVAVPFLAWSSWRLLRTMRLWGDPVARAWIVTTVAA